MNFNEDFHYIYSIFSLNLISSCKVFSNAQIIIKWKVVLKIYIFTKPRLT